MIPDESKRGQFLRGYLDANYDVTVGNGQGVLFAMRIVTDNGTETDDTNVPNDSKYEVVGGVLFVPPAKEGYGWEIGSDEPYWTAYEKYGLGRISADGLERVKR